MKRPTENALLAALRQYGKATARRPAGKDWATLAEMALEDGVTLPAIRYKLRMAQRNGVRVETATGTVLDSEGNAKRATFYKFAGKNGGKP